MVRQGWYFDEIPVPGNLGNPISRHPRILYAAPARLPSCFLFDHRFPF